MIRVLLLMAVAVPAHAQIQLLPATRASTATAKEEPAKDDGKILSEGQLSPSDGDGLVQYFEKRTLSEDQLQRIKAIIRRMGDESFEERMKASDEAEKIGLGAIGPLRAAATTEADPEISFRALETLKKVEKVPQSAVAAAAARALVKLKHPKATEALLGFIPMADNAAVEDDLRDALAKLAVNEGKFDPAIVKALKDVNPVRRGAAGYAMALASLDGGALADQATAAVKEMLKAETDADAKYRVAYVLGTKGKNPAAIAALAETLPGLTRGRVWQVEDVLLQLAGDKAPKILLGDKASLEKASKEWVEWLAKNRTPEDYAKFDYKPRTSGHLVILSVDNNSWGNGKLIEYGTDLRPRWRLSGITSPADFRMLPNGNVEIVEQNYNRIRELTTRGVEKSNKPLPMGQPMSVQRLDNGNVLVAYRQSVVEYDKDWKQLHAWPRNNQDVMCAARLGNGPTVVLVNNNGNNGNLIRLDEKFKELPDSVKIGNPTYQAKMEVLPNNRVLVTEQEQVAEYDMSNKDAKAPVWKYGAKQATCVQRLPNGNTLVCDMNNRKVVEVGPGGEALWTYTPLDNMQPMRAYRQ